MFLDVWYLSSNADAAYKHEYVAILSDFNSFAIKTVYQCLKCL